MATDIDWQHEIDDSVGRAPDRPTAHYVTAGHRAVRRRRTAAAIAGLAVVAVLGGIGGSTLPGPPRPEQPIATDPGPTVGQTAETDPAPTADSPADVREAGPGEVEDFGAPDPVTVVAMGSGELVHMPGWQVDDLEVLVDRDGKRVWGLATSPVDGGKGQWILLTWRTVGYGASTDVAGKRFATFEEWLDATWARAQGDTGEGSR